MLNKIILMGRLTRDPELRRTESGTAVCSFSIAVDRDFKSKNGEKETDFRLPSRQHAATGQSGKRSAADEANGDTSRLR